MRISQQKELTRGSSDTKSSSITRRNLVAGMAVVASALAARKAHAQACPPPSQGQPCVCFLAGSRILTPDGEVAVNELRIGEPVVTISGESKTIRWIGRMSFERERGKPWSKDVAPIKVVRGALDAGMPHTDLY